MVWYHHYPEGPEKVHHDYCNLAIVTSMPPYIKGPKKRHYHNFEMQLWWLTGVSSKFKFNSMG